MHAFSDSTLGPVLIGFFGLVVVVGFGSVSYTHLDVYKRQIHGSMAWTLLLGFVALTLVFVWMVGVRYRIEVLADRTGAERLEVSLAERWAEGDLDMAGPPGSPATRNCGAVSLRPPTRVGP